MTHKRHTRNPIKHHGRQPDDGHVRIPNDMVRDGGLSSDAFRVYALLVSHDPERFEESEAGIAERYGWGQGRTKKAMNRLQDERLLVVQRFVTARCTRAYETYHVHLDGRFTDAERAELSQAVVLGSPKTDDGGYSKRVGRVTQNESWGLLKTDEGGYSKRVTKESQLEPQPEPQAETQPEPQDWSSSSVSTDREEDQEVTDPRYEQRQEARARGECPQCGKPVTTPFAEGFCDESCFYEYLGWEIEEPTPVS